MKIKLLLRLGLVLSVAIFAGFKSNPEAVLKSVGSSHSVNHPAIVVQQHPTDAVLLAKGTVVYVCDSKYAKKYHYSSNCRGLNACKHEIVKMSKSTAEDRGLSLCSWD